MTNILKPWETLKNMSIKHMSKPSLRGAKSRLTADLPTVVKTLLHTGAEAASCRFGADKEGLWP